MTPAAPVQPRDSVEPLQRSCVAARGLPRGYIVALATLSVVCALPLYELAVLCVRSELHQYIFLIPLISVFLVRREDASLVRSNPKMSGEFAASIAAGIALLCWFAWLRYGQNARPVDSLWAATSGYLLLLLANEIFWFGTARVKAHSFAVALLIFAVPLPPIITDAMSHGLQAGSAEVADWMLRLTGLPVFRVDMRFQLPGLMIQVAEECSGVRSTLVLFITSFVAGKLFLKAGWKRVVLAFATIPIGLLRNGLRITTISWLTVNVDPGIINGPLHNQGGPLFFVISLIPLFVLLAAFRKSESSTTHV